MTLALAPVLASILLVAAPPAGNAAQEDWSPPVILYRTSTGYVTYPRLVVDPWGVVHLYFIERETEDPRDFAYGQIRHAQLQDGNWSEAIPVLTSPNGLSVDRPAFAIDSAGTIYATWLSRRRDVYFSRAPARLANQASSWSTPRIVSPAEAANADIVASPDGDIHLFYARFGTDLYHRRSTDGGINWSRPIRVSSVAEGDCATDYPRSAIDQRGAVHAVWTELQLPNAQPPCGLRYSRSTDGGQSWTPPLNIAGRGYTQANLVTSPPDTINLVWNSQVSIGQRWHQRSWDGGLSWSPPEFFTPTLYGGITGFPGVVIDSVGRLHVATSVDSQHGNMRAEGIYHLAQENGVWSAPELVSIGAVGERSIEQPWIASSSGNRLHVVYEDDFKRIWYSSRTVDAPEARPASPVASASLLNSPDKFFSAPSPVPISRGTARASAQLLPDAEKAPTETQAGIAWGSLVSAVVVGAALSLKALRR